MLRMSLLLPFVAIVAGCGACPPAPVERCESDETLPEGGEGLTWLDVAPVIEEKCTRCHRAGGLAPFSLESYGDVVENAHEISHAVLSREMPPFMPEACCNRFQNDTSLSDQQIADLVRWIDEGTARGDPTVEPPPGAPPPSLERVDVTLEMSDAYTPDPAEGAIDDYRCFLVDWPFEEQRFVTGFSMQPGNPAVLHHALVLLLSPDQVETYRELDGADGRPGWSCWGGGVLGAYGYVGGWSPGWEAQRTPEGFGHAVSPGSALVFSMHYTRPESGEDFGEDRSRIDLTLEDSVDGTLVAVGVYDATWPLGGMPIPANDPDVRWAVEYDPTTVYTGGQPLDLFSVNLHMHERGSKGQVILKHADGTTECLLQIDDYLHEWQGDYLFETPVRIESGDKLYVECRFDNTEGRQRIVDGERQEPRDINWGDDQEMCVAWLTAAPPLDDG